MTRRSSLRLPGFFVLALLTAFSLPGLASAAAILTSGTGLLASDIQDEVDAFRAALGEPNNANNPGPLAGGRREINWDGGGAVTPSVGGTPFTVFQDTRGATMTTPGTGFIQAAPADLGVQFGNASYATTFAAFSPLRLFAPIGSNVTDVTFSVPGTAGTKFATVSAFGAVFSDVDADTTTIEFFTPHNISLGVFDVPDLAGTATFSFLGVQFDAGEEIGRARITTGNIALGPDDLGFEDVVVMDDFLYAEPVPGPAGLALAVLGAGASLAARGPRRTAPSTGR